MPHGDHPIEVTSLWVALSRERCARQVFRGGLSSPWPSSPTQSQQPDACWLCLHTRKSELQWSLGPGLEKAAHNSLCLGCEALNSPAGLRGLETQSAVNKLETGSLFPGIPTPTRNADSLLLFITARSMRQ